MLIFSIIISVFVGQTISQIDPCFNVLRNTGIDNTQSANDLLQTGAITIVSSQPPQRIQSANISLSTALLNSIRKQIAVSPNFISKYIISNNEIEFKAQGLITETNIVVSIIIVLTSTWAQANINYIVSGLQTLRVSSFSVDEPALLQPMQQRQFIFKNQLEPVLNPQIRQTLVSVYLSGLKTYDLQLGINILDENIFIDENSVVTVAIKTINQKQPIQFISFACIVYTNFEPQVGIVSTMNLQRILQQSLEQDNSQFYNHFIGMKDFEGSQVEALINQNRRLLMEQISMLIKTPQIQLFTSGFGLQGLSFQNLENQGQLLTGLNQTTFQCVTADQCSLRNGVTYFDSELSQVFCFQCPQNKTFVPSQNQCVCKQNFYLKSDVCVSKVDICEVGQYFIEGQCFLLSIQSNQFICGRNQIFNQITKRCQCVQFYVKVLQNNIVGCQFPCSQNQFLNISTGECKCIQGNLNNRGQCIICDSFSEIWNQLTKNCQCIDSYFRVNGICRRCSRNSFYDQTNKKCICNPGYQGTGLVCRPL